MTIKPHCMGMEFPKRDTDGPNVKWVSQVPYFHSCPICGGPHATIRESSLCWAGLPSETDLDAKSIEFEQEAGNRWIAEDTSRPGAMVYGRTKQEALRNLHTLINDLDRVAEEQRVKDVTDGSK